MKIKKVFNLGSGIKLMLSGGVNKKGAYGYGGIKHKSGFSAGTSIGTKGHQNYLSYHQGRSQIRVMKNTTTGKIKPKIKLR